MLLNFSHHPDSSPPVIPHLMRYPAHACSMRAKNESLRKSMDCRIKSGNDDMVGEMRRRKKVDLNPLTAPLEIASARLLPNPEFRPPT